jgi:branched-chain amino acid transport system ATP-binding protein
VALLEIQGLSVRFGGNLAVNEVDLAADVGEITGLIGPNGAGKTTTFNLVCGVLTPTAGRVVLDGADLTEAGTHRRARAGIARTFQRIEVFGSMSARENVQVGVEFRRSWSRRSRENAQLLAAPGVELSVDDEIDLIMERLGLTDIADVRSGELPTGQARLVELGRALAIRPKVLLLDEPASGLDETESDALGELLVELARGGLAVLLVEHDMPLVMRVCDQISVLDFGTLIASGTPDEIRQNPQVIDAYLGSELV